MVDVYETSKGFHNFVPSRVVAEGDEMANVTLFIAAAVIVMSSPILMLFSQGKPQAGEVALVISTPWGPDAARIAEKAGLQEVAPERAPLGVLVALDSAQSVDRLYSNGAWLVINGKKVLELCSI